MKVAEALLLRADIKKKLASLRERITANCMVQEGEQPSEDAQELLEQSFRLLKEHTQLVCQINRANQSVKLADGRSMMEAIAERDHLTAKHSLVKATADSAKRAPDYYSHREIKWKSVMKVSPLEKLADDISKQIRELNTLIQSTNWTADLPEL